MSDTLMSFISAFLTDLRHANRAAATLRTYGTDLHHFAVWSNLPLVEVNAEHLRAYFATLSDLKPASRARKQAALASFLSWAFRHDYIATNPMQKIDRVRRDPPTRHGLPRSVVETILAAIPKAQERDRLLFRLLFETGLRIGEALHLHVEDLELRWDDEHLRVSGKGGSLRTILLDDPRLVKQLRTYLTHSGYQHGLLFRA